MSEEDRVLRGSVGMGLFEVGQELAHDYTGRPGLFVAQIVGVGSALHSLTSGCCDLGEVGPDNQGVT